jgi:carbonic anhydrase
VSEAKSTQPIVLIGLLVAILKRQDEFVNKKTDKLNTVLQSRRIKKQKMKLKMLTMASLAIFLISCNQGGEKQKETAQAEKPVETIQPVSHVMTKEEQAALTPDQVIQQFIDGNKRFQTGVTTVRDHREQARKSATGQFPKAVVLSCLDSRVPVEDVFDQGLGDIFVGRVAGNFVNEDLLGSMEFACKVAGAKLVLVMGHQHCGAVKGAIDDVKLGNLTATLANIKPAVKMSQDFTGEKTSKNDEFVKHVSENNVKYAIQQIREKSPILKEMEDKGEIKIVGAFYNLTDGSLEFIN